MASRFLYLETLRRKTIEYTGRYIIVALLNDES